MKIVDASYSVVAVVVAVILFAQSVAGDDSYKSKAGKGGPVGDWASLMWSGVLARALVGHVYGMIGVESGGSFERDEFEQILNTSFFDGSAVWDIDIFLAVNIDEDDTITEEELVTHLQANLPFTFRWALAGKEGSKAGKGGNADPELSFWLGIYASSLVKRFYTDADVAVGESIDQAHFKTAIGKYGSFGDRASVFYERTRGLNNEAVEFPALRRYVQYAAGGWFTGIDDLDTIFFIGVHRQLFLQAFYSSANVEVGTTVNMERWEAALRNLPWAGINASNTFQMLDLNENGTIDIDELGGFLM